MKKIDPIETLREDIEENTPQVKFKTIDGEGTHDPIWLANLPEFTVFLARDKARFDKQTQQYIGKSIDLREYHVLVQRDRSTRLLCKVPGATPFKLWVSTADFSLNMEKFEVLYVPLGT